MMLLLFVLLQDDAARLIQALRAGDVEQREAAMRRLKDLGDKALPELQKAAGDPDQEVAGRARFLLRRAAVSAKISDALRQAAPGVEDRLASGDHAWTQVWMDLEKRGDDEIPPAILEPLAAPGLRGARTDAEKMWACRTAASRAYASAGGEVVKLLEDPSDDVKAAAMQALMELRSPEAIPVLVQKVREGREEIRAQAEMILLQLAPSVPAAKLAELLKSDSPRLRTAGLRMIGNLGKESAEAMPGVLAALGDADREVRAAALGVLGQYKQRDAAPRIAALLKDPSATVRQSAAAALGAVGARDQAPAVAALLADEAVEVRLTALETLVELGAAEAAGPITGLVRDPDLNVRREAARALVGLGATGSAASLRPLLKDPKDDVRLIAVWALGQLRARDAAQELAVFLEHADASFRASAASALGRMGAPAAAAALRKALDDKSALVRNCAAEALGRIGPDVGHDPLLLLLYDPNPGVRASAARALADLGASEAVPLLQSLLEDGADIDEAEDAEIDRLERFADSPELVDRYDRTRGAVKGAAADALCRLGYREGITVLIEAVDDDYEAASLTSLNAFRRPDVARRLQAIPLQETLGGTSIARFRRLAAAAGLEMKLEDLDEDDPGRPLAPLKADGALSLWDALLATAEACELDVVIDRRRLRLYDDSEVLDFWSMWWESEKEE